jgi:hypothetical protein
VAALPSMAAGGAKRTSQAMSRYPWVKMSSDILDNPVLMRAAREGHPQVAFLPYIVLFAGKADDNGRLTVGGKPAEPEDIAPGIPGAVPASVRACLAALAEIGFLLEEPGGVLRLADWLHSSGKPSDQPERVRDRVKNHRQRKRGNPPVTPVETRAETRGNALRNATEGDENRVDENRKEKPSAPGGAAVQRVTWLTPFADAWRDRFGGTMPMGRAAKALKPLLDQHGAAEALRRWRNYLQSAEASYANPARFASTWGQWNQANSGNGRSDVSSRTFRNSLEAVPDRD